MSDILLMTQEELERLKLHARTVQAQLKDALAAMGAGAEADSNTWHDNPAFEEAARTVDMYTTEFGKIKAQLSRAVVVSASSTDVVGIGSTVVVQFDDDDEPETMKIGGDHVVGGLSREDKVLVISSSSPMGKAIFGKSKGDRFGYSTPKGAKFSGEILDIS